MSLNTAHVNKAVLIHSGEDILLHCKNVFIQFLEPMNKIFPTYIPGYFYLTSHRIIFRSKRCSEQMKSLSAPFVTIDDISVNEEADQISNSIKFAIRAQPNGHLVGVTEFKLFFNSNQSALELVDIIKWIIARIQRLGINVSVLPVYTPPRNLYEAPVVLGKNIASLFKERLSTTSELLQIPKPNSVYVTDNSPPFPGNLV